jgi:hypothetical protein
MTGIKVPTHAEHLSGAAKGTNLAGTLPAAVNRARAEQLRWWRQGFDAGQATRRADLRLAAAQDRHLTDLHRAVLSFDDSRRAERQAAVGELIGELVGVLATAMLGADTAADLPGAA